MFSFSEGKFSVFVTVTVGTQIRTLCLLHACPQSTIARFGLISILTPQQIYLYLFVFHFCSVYDKNTYHNICYPTFFSVIVSLNFFFNIKNRLHAFRRYSSKKTGTLPHSPVLPLKLPFLSSLHKFLQRDNLIHSIFTSLIHSLSFYTTSKK